MIATKLTLFHIGLAKYSKFPKLWMMKGQILYQMNDIANARKFYAKGLENCRDAIPLWLLLARLEEDLGLVIPILNLSLNDDI